MAAPTLTLLNSTSISTCEAVTNFTKFDTLEPDIKKEGSNSMTGTFRTDGTSGYYDAGSAPVTAAGKTVRFWLNTTNLPYMEPESNGGYELLMYDGTTSEYKTMFGSDTYFGGWFQAVWDCDDFSTLTLANVQRWGIRIQHAASAKNVDNCWIDAIKYLDGYSMTGGTSGDEITLATIEEADRGTTTLYGYGVLIEFGGVYYCTGDMQFGTGATTTWVLVDGEILIFEDKPVAAGLYKLSGVGAGTRVTIQNSVLRGSGTTDATRFDMDWSDTNLLSLTFTSNLIVRADTTVFKSGQSPTGNTYDDCGQITHAGADLSDSTFKNYEGTADTSYVVYNVNADPDGELDNCSFTKGTAATHAIEFGTLVPATMTLRGCDFSGYNAADTNTDSTFYFADTGGAITLNLVNCTGNLTYKSAGATITLVEDPRTVTVTAQTTGGTAIQSANVFLRTKTGGTGPFPENDTVTIVNSGTTATVTHTAHGMATGDYVLIEGASLDANNGVFQITYISTSSYSYTMGSTPGSSPTGTIKCWFVFLKGLTDVNGEIDMSRVIPSSQDVEGWSAKASGSPYYKNGTISGTVLSSADTPFTATMGLDE